MNPSNAARPLGSLTRLDVREAWEREDTNFTRWLAEESNLRLLADAINIELELETVEHRVGSFRADIRCKETGSNRVVIIENQLETTDHSHLGQLLTYAAGTSLVSIVWITPHFREEHRAALDWLNEVTNENVEFFGLELELWKIGDSLPAPRLNLVVKPNDWTRLASVERSSGGESQESQRSRAQLEFWQAFGERVASGSHSIRASKPRAENWMPFAVGRSNTYLYASVRMGRGTYRIAWAAVGPDRFSLRDYLQADGAELERLVGAPLTWHATESGKEVHARVDRESNLSEDPQSWPPVIEDIIAILDRMYSAFVPRIQQFRPRADTPA